MNYRKITDTTIKFNQVFGANYVMEAFKERFNSKLEVLKIKLK